MYYPNILSILFLFLFCSAKEVASRASFGENCSRESRCESRNFLTCSPIENTCICLMPDTMTYEESSGQCVALAGERCQYTALEGERTWSDEIPCISNAACVNGMCECTSNYYEVASGTCLQKGDYGQNCSSNSMCSSEKHVICGPEQTCICEANRILDGGDCHLKAGERCNPHTSNVPNHNCLYRSRCSRDPNDYEYRCTCENQFFLTSTGLCERKRNFGQPCSEDKQCNEEKLFTCNQNTKTCDCSKGFGYHPEQLRCQNSPNAGHCSSDQECVPNAKCSTYYRDQTCKCKSGSNSFSGYCLISENYLCNDEEIFVSVNVKVNGQTTDRACLPGLVCRNSKCSCLYKDHQVYNESGNDMCESLVGGPCNETTDCIRNSECRPTKEGLMECQCKEGFIQAGRRCDIAYGQKCRQGDLSSRCDQYGPLECSVRRICECSEFQVYDRETLKCKGLVGAKCDIKENYYHPFVTITPPEKEVDKFCVDGAICKTFRGVKSGLCACENGKLLGKDRTCVLPRDTKEVADVTTWSTTGTSYYY